MCPNVKTGSAVLFKAEHVSVSITALWPSLAMSDPSAAVYLNLDGPSNNHKNNHDVKKVKLTGKS